MNVEEVKRKIDFITSSEHHDGEYGYTVDVKMFPAKYKNTDLLCNYLEFLSHFGYGELDSSFYIEEQPLEWDKVFPEERSHLEGTYIFATDQGEYCYAFDSKQNYNIVEISADGEVSESTLGNFQEFIAVKLDELVEIVRWRHENL
jgi:hypothetical protein